MSERTDLLISIADDELCLGWRDSEWTGIAPFLEEDVAFSSLSQNEIGHARALYQLVAEELGTTPDALVFERSPEEFRSCPLVELRLVPDWARTIARHFLYETADSFRLAALKEIDVEAVAGLAAKIDREEVYHRMHARMWADRLLGSPEGRERLKPALVELWPYALGVLGAELNPGFVDYVQEAVGFELPEVEPVRRGIHLGELVELLEEMTTVRRLAPAGRW